MNSFKHKITVIVPAYNVEKVLHHSLDSLEKQTSKHFEVLIVNDGSTDCTKQAIDPFLKRNLHWKYFEKTNGHWGSVINYVIKNNLIKGEYVTILDADDWFVDTAIEEVQRHLAKDAAIDIILSKITLFSKNKYRNFPVILFKSKYVKKNQARTPLSTPHGKFYKTSLFNKLTPLKENIPYQDVILYHDLVTKSNRIYYINRSLSVWWFDRPENSTQAQWDEKRINLWLDNIEEINKTSLDPEIIAYSLMYLWELKRRTKIIPIRKIKINTKNVKFKWVPFYIRMFLPIKTYFKFKTKKFINKKLD